MNRLACLLALAAVTATPFGAHAYYVDGRAQADGGAVVPLRFDSTEPVAYRVASAGMPDGDGSEFEAIEKAFETWASVDCVTLTFTRGADEDSPTPMHWMMGGEQGYILVWWSMDAATWAGSLEYAVGYADKVDDGNGTLIDGQIILNGLTHSWSTTGEPDTMDVQSVVTALLGRLLGITSSMEGNATYPSYAAGDTSKRDLGDDDTAAIEYLYGDGTCTPADPEAVCVMGRGELADGGVVNPCPPRPETNPGDGGTGGGGGDSGTGTGGGDAGAGGGDAGMGGTPSAGGGDGCGCVVAGGTPGLSGSWLALGLLGLLAGWRLRRRR